MIHPGMLRHAPFIYIGLVLLRFASDGKRLLQTICEHYVRIFIITCKKYCIRYNWLYFICEHYTQGFLNQYFIHCFFGEIYEASICGSGSKEFITYCYYYCFLVFDLFYRQALLSATLPVGGNTVSATGPRNRLSANGSKPLAAGKRGTFRILCG